MCAHALTSLTKNAATPWLVVPLLLCLALFSCSPIRHVRPVPKGESSIALGLGGPVTQAGSAYIPLPLLSLGYNYGLLERLDLEAGFHVTSALFGVLHLDAGVNWRPLHPLGLRPGVALSPKVFFLTDFNSHGTRVYPDLGVTACWKVSPRVYLYGGIENWFELVATRTDGNSQPTHWLPCPYLGTDIGGNKWRFQLEARLYTPNMSNLGRATRNIGLGEHGILGAFLGVSRTLGGGRHED